MSTPPVTLRSAEASDDAFLLTVYASTRDGEMAMLSDWSDEQKREFLAMQHRAQTTDYGSRFPHADYDIVEVFGQPIGRLWVDRHESEIRILDITVLPEFQGRGIGTTMLRRLQSEAAASGLPLRDSVFNGNSRAEALYLRLGFVETNDTGTYTALEWRATPSD